jgi:hypothetical protein
MNTSDIIDKVFQIQKNLVGKSDILAYLNIAQKWAFKMDLEAFKVYSPLVTTTGTLSYSFASLTIPCRKLIAVTPLTDEEIFGTNPATIDPDYDYGMNRNWASQREENVPGRIDLFGQTFTFIEDPGTESTKWRWIYYRNPVDLTGPTDNTNLILPEQYHLNLIQATSRICDFETHQEAFNFKEIEQYFKDFWEDMADSSTAIGDGNNSIDEGNLP